LPVPAREVTARHPGADTRRDASEWQLQGYHEDGLRALPGHAALAIDGRASTRWATGRSMQPGDWFQVDLGKPTEIGRCEMDVGPWTADLPHGLRIETSDDGVAWTEVAAFSEEEIRGSVNGSRVVLETGPLTTRLLRFVQTGDAAPWWSIAELYVD
jgi:hypothetical protein